MSALVHAPLERCMYLPDWSDLPTRCTADSAVVLVIGCVHEHDLTGGACLGHLDRLREIAAAAHCSTCADAGHECRVVLVAERPA